MPFHSLTTGFLACGYWNQIGRRKKVRSICLEREVISGWLQIASLHRVESSEVFHVSFFFLSRHRIDSANRGCLLILLPSSAVSWACVTPMRPGQTRRLTSDSIFDFSLARKSNVLKGSGWQPWVISSLDIWLHRSRSPLFASWGFEALRRSWFVTLKFLVFDDSRKLVKIHFPWKEKSN